MIPRHLPLPTWRALASIGTCVALIAALAAPALAQAAPYPTNDDFVRHEVVVDERDRPARRRHAHDGHERAGGAVARARTGPAAAHGGRGPRRAAAPPRSQSCSTAFTPLLGLYTGFDVAAAQRRPRDRRPPRAASCRAATGQGVALRFHAVEGTAYRIATATDSLGRGLRERRRPDAAARRRLRRRGGPPGRRRAGRTSRSDSPPSSPASPRTAAAPRSTAPGTPTPRPAASACASTPARQLLAPSRHRHDLPRRRRSRASREVASSRDGRGCGARHGGQVEALLDAGVAYRIAVTQDDPTAEPVTVRLPRSPRDDSATTPSKLTSGRSVDLALATREPGEPDHAGQAGGRSRWKVVDAGRLDDVRDLDLPAAPTAPSRRRPTRCSPSTRARPARRPAR